MSFMTRLWNVIRNPIRCVGRDLEGNKFYERPSPNDLTRTTRSVQYQNPEDMWKYTSGGKRLPIQWSAWLTHTRPHPPTIEELQADLARQQRLLTNVALIEARDRAEEQERMRIRQEDAQIALQRALTDVSSSGEYLHQQERALGLGGKVEEVASPVLSTGALGQSNGPKMRPPAFLTPAKSPKSQTTMPISARTTEPLTQGALGREHQCQRKTVEESLDTAQSDSQTQTSAEGVSPLPVMPSRATETESWAPKAKARR